MEEHRHTQSIFYKYNIKPVSAAGIKRSGGVEQTKKRKDDELNRLWATPIGYDTHTLDEDTFR